MAQKEGTVYLYLFVVAMVLFVGSMVAFYVSYNDTQKLQKDLDAVRIERDDAKSAHRKTSFELKALKDLVVGEGQDLDPQSIRDDHLLKVHSVINNARQDLPGLSEVKFQGYLIEPFGYFKDILDKYKGLRDTAVTAMATQLATQESTRDTLSKSIDDLKAQLAEKADAESEAQRKWEDCENSANAEKTRLTEELAREQERCADLEIAYNRKMQRLQNEINTMEIKLAKLQEQVRKELDFKEIEPDGRLLSVDQTLGKGWINLGRRDALRTGLVFRVFRRIKGGKMVEKGRVEIRKVDEETAEVRVVEELDPLNAPIARGDLISSPFFDKKEKPILVIAGHLQSQDVTLEYLKAKLTHYGVELRSSVDIHTSFLVALEDYSVTPEYKVAQNLGVPILRESDLLQFIGH